MPRARRWVCLAVGGMGVVAMVGLLHGGASKKHQFEGRCQECHVGMPRRGAPLEEVALTDEVDRLCARCHRMDTRSSHPVGITPRVAIPLQRYLDHQGRLTCVTCHDVHQEEDRSLSPLELTGLLRGHVRGRQFCATCHQEELVGAGWRHAFAVSSAHMFGRLTPAASGAPLDDFSVECLSCHDGGISTRAEVVIRAGVFQHGEMGESHPVGVVYPRGIEAKGYVDPSALPQGVRLFDGKVGCLSCHNPYSTRPALLVMDMTGSALCLACHRK